MTSLRCIVVLAIIMGCAGRYYSNPAIGETTKKETIKTIMRKSMTAGLCKKVIGGKATKSEKEDLVKLFEKLQKLSPPKGKKEDWTKRTKELHQAAKDVVDGKSGAVSKLKKNANCGSCHRNHKP